MKKMRLSYDSKQFKKGSGGAKLGLKPDIKKQNQKTLVKFYYIFFMNNMFWK